MKKKYDIEYKMETTAELHVTDAVLEELMSKEWRSSFYTFDDVEEAKRWLTWVVEKWGMNVDGLAHLSSDDVSVERVDEVGPDPIW